jgi:serine/threonine protein kinase
VMRKGRGTRAKAEGASQLSRTVQRSRLGLQELATIPVEEELVSSPGAAAGVEAPKRQREAPTRKIVKAQPSKTAQAGLLREATVRAAVRGEDARVVAAVPTFAPAVVPGAQPLVVSVAAVKKAKQPATSAPADLGRGAVGLVTGGPLEELLGPAETLGEGTYGIVFGYQTIKHGPVAVKVTKRDLEGGFDVESLKELSILVSLQHPNVVRVIDAFVTPKAFAIVLPRAGEALDTRLSRLATTRSIMPIADAKLIILQLARGMAYVQSRDVLNGDYKPANVLVYEAPDCRLRVVLADFGLASTNRCFQTKASGVVFTSWWRAPELLLGGPYEPAADTWALGVMAVEILTGKKPWTYDSNNPTPEGEERSLLADIFLRLGLPDEVSWPGVTALPGPRPIRGAVGILARRGFVPEMYKKIIDELYNTPANPNEYKLTPEGFPLASRWSYTLPVGSPRTLLPPEAQQFLNSMIVLDPKRRASALDVTMHPFLASAVPELNVPCQRETSPLGSSDCEVALRARAVSVLVNPDMRFVNTRMRAICYSWLFDVIKEFKLSERTLGLAIYLLERYWTKRAIEREYLQLIAVVAMHIATSICDEGYATTDDFIFISDYTYTLAQIARIDVDMLEINGVDLHVATTYDLARSYAQSYSELVRSHTIVFVNLSYFSAVSTGRPANLIALLCVALACEAAKEPFRHATHLSDTYGRAAVSEAVKAYGAGLAETLSTKTLAREILDNVKRGATKVGTLIRSIPVLARQFGPDALSEGAEGGADASSAAEAIAALTSKLSSLTV